MKRHTYTDAQVRARDLREDDVILVMPGEGEYELPMWRDVMDVWHDADIAEAEDKYSNSDGWRDDAKIEYIREHLSGGLSSYVLVRYHVETLDVAEGETDLVAFRTCDLVTVQQPENPTVLDEIDWTDAEAVHARVAGLPRHGRLVLHDALTSMKEAEAEAEILALTRAFTDQEDILALSRSRIDQAVGRRAVAVQFKATPGEGGYIKGLGTVLFEDGVTAPLHFGQRLAELLARHYGHVTPAFGVLVDLRTNHVDAAEYGDIDLHALTDTPRPPVNPPENES